MRRVKIDTVQDRMLEELFNHGGENRQFAIKAGVYFATAFFTPLPEAEYLGK